MKSALYYTHNGVLLKIISTKLVELIPNKPIQIQSILDIGCGTGFVAQKLIEKGFSFEKILQIDFNSNSLEIAKQYSKIKKNNFNCPLNFEEKFDLITSSMSLQWSQNINQTIDEIKKNLTNDGKFIFSIPLLGSLAEIYTALKIPNFLFHKQENINAKLIFEKTYHENAFIALKNIHLCNLKINSETSSQKIDKNTIKFLKMINTKWNIGWFIVEN